VTPTRQRRLILVGLILLAVGTAATLTVLALSKYQTYLYSPSEVLAGQAPTRASFRIGGVVLEHSLRRAPDSLQVEFVVTDRFHELPVVYTGILPDLFREGQSIVATGHLDGGRFVAREVLAKHDETYMPKEVADAIAKAKAAQPRPTAQ
jgi:cytochrome c-type biogenesis protein CcmE